jgi:hypothetical protein
VRRAQPLEEDRFEVREEDIHEHFRNLNELGISITSPHLILNLDETGFESSKSGRMKSRQVIVPFTFHGTPVSKKTTDSHFVTALCVIALAGDVLAPGLIAKRGTDHPDGTECSYFAEARRHTSPKAFVTRAIFGADLRDVILSYIVSWREKLGAEAPAILLFDGHKTHLHELLNT